MAVADDAFKVLIRDEVQSQLAAALSDVDVLGLQREVLRLHGEVVELQAKLALGTKTADACNARNRDAGKAANILAEQPGYTFLLQERADEEQANLPAVAESMYSYCVSTLAKGDRLWTEPAAWYLMLLSFSQQVLVQLMLHGFWSARIKRGWQGVSHPSLYQCLFFHSPDPLNIKTTHGEATEQVVGSVVVILLTATLIKHDDVQALRSLYPSKESRLSIRCFVNVFWCIHCIYLPFLVAVVTSGLMAVSSDGMDVVMNSLVMVFVLEVDDLMYEHFLTDERKTAYQALTRDHNFGHVNVAFIARAQWLVSMCLMLGHYAFDVYMAASFSGKVFVMIADTGHLRIQRFFLLMLVSGLGMRVWLQYTAGDEARTPVVVCQSLGAVLVILVAVFCYWSVLEHFVGASVMDPTLWLACLGD